jgi:WD40 repeat protein/tetratricopeptide (TPR) repeat protein
MPTQFPYPGLRPFREDEADIFFGREEQTDHLLQKLGKNKFLGVVGPSGCGKSSLLRAGMISALKTGFMAPAGARWRIAVMRPGSHPIKRLAEALMAESALGPERAGEAEAVSFLDAILRRGPLGLVEVLRETPIPQNTNLLLLVDQFEEIFRFRTDQNRNEQDAFVEFFLETSVHRELPIYIVIAMRSDYLGDCALFPRLPEALNESQYLTPRMTREQREAAIVGPARVFCGDVEPALVNRLLNESGTDPNQLPVLQHVLMRMWSCTASREECVRGNIFLEGIPRENLGHVLTLTDYEKVGGLTEALSMQADEAFETLNPEQKRIAEILFRSLCERGGGRRDGRRPTPVSEVATRAETHPDRVVDIVEVFRKSGYGFLVPPVPEKIFENTILDITHESLIRLWRRLNVWVHLEAESSKEYRFLEETARRWKAGKGSLWGTPDLEIALEWKKREHPSGGWAGRYGGDFDLAMKFLDASEQEQKAQKARVEKEHKSKLREARRWAARLLILFVAAGLAAVLALMYGLEARNARDEAQKAREGEKAAHEAEMKAEEGNVLALRKLANANENTIKALKREDEANKKVIKALKGYEALRLAAVAINSLNEDPERSILLGLQAASLSQATGNTISPWVEDALHQSVQASRLMRTFSSGHKDGVWSVALSPDGRRLAMTYDSDKVRVLKSATGKELPKLIGHRGEVLCVTFSRDGKRIGTSGDDKTGRVWSSDTGKELFSLSGHEAPVLRIVFSRDGRFIATASMDKTAILWDGNTGKRSHILTGHEKEVWDVAFSPDGKRLATASWDGTARIWDTGSGKPIHTLVGHTAAVMGVSFSPNDHGRRLATSSKDKTVKIWDTESGRPIPLPQVPRHDNTVIRVVFSPDGKRLATAGYDGTAKIWDAASGREVSTFCRAEDAVMDIMFSDDGSRIATASLDGTARVWDKAGRPLPPSPFANITARINAISISPDGTKAATAGQDKKAIVWDLRSGEKRLILIGHNDAVKDVAFSPDGTVVATADSDGKVKLWDASSGKEKGELPCRKGPGHRYDVVFLAFSPTGKRLATAGEDKTAIIWDYESRKQLFILKELEKDLRCLAFSPDGKFIATGGETIIIWDAATGEKLKEEKRLKELTEMKGKFRQIIFSPEGNGECIAAAFGNKAAIWKWGSEEQPIWLTGNPSSIYKLVFNKKGSLIATGNADRTTRIWNTRTGQELMSLHGHRDAVSGVAFNPNTNSLVTCSWDGMVKEWDIRENRELLPPAGPGSGVCGIAFSPDSRLIVTASRSGKAKSGEAAVWDVRLGSSLVRLSGFEGTVYDAAFSPDGELVATAHEDKRVRIWNARSGGLLSILEGQKDEVLSVAFSRDGRKVASASADGMVAIWDLMSGYRAQTFSILDDGKENGKDALILNLLLRFFLGKDSTVAFSSDLTSVTAISSDRKTAALWNAASGKRIVTFAGHKDTILSIAFSRDDKRLVTGSVDGTAKIWNAETGGEVLTLWGHKAPVTYAIFSDDGRRIATASIEDRTIRVWDATTGQTIYKLQGHSSGDIAVAFSPDGKLIAAVSRDGAVDLFTQDVNELLTMARRRVTRPLNEEDCHQFLKDQKCPRSVLAIDSYIRGRNNAQSGNFTLAMADFRKARELDQTGLRFDPGREATEIANERAEEFIQVARYQEAVTILVKTSTFDPANDRAHFLLGLTYRKQKKMEEAASYFEKVKKGAPDYARSLEYMGAIYHDHLGRYEDGYRTFRLIVEMYPRDINNLMNLAEGCVVTKRWDEARTRAQKILDESQKWNLNAGENLTMRFIVISSLVLQGKDEEAHGKIQEFLSDYNKNQPGYKPSWSYDGTRKFLEKQEMDNARKNCLLKLVELLTTPTQNISGEDLGEYMNSPRKAHPKPGTGQ